MNKKLRLILAVLAGVATCATLANYHLFLTELIWLNAAAITLHYHCAGWRYPLVWGMYCGVSAVVGCIVWILLPDENTFHKIEW